MTDSSRTPGSHAVGLGRLILRDSVLYGAGHVAARSTYLILVPVLTRALAPPELGAVDLLTAASAIALSLVSLEISQGLARFVSAEEDPDERRRLASSALWYGLVAFCALVAVGLVFAEPISDLILEAQGEPEMVRAAALAAGANGIFLIVHGQLRWELRAGAYAVAATVLAFATLAATVGFVGIAGAGIVGVFASQFVGAILATTLVLWLVRGSFGFAFSSSALRRILRFSVPLVPAAIAAFVAANVDRFVISRALGNAEVGLYGVGYRMASIVGLAVVAFQLALTPLIYARYRQTSTPHELATVFGGYVAVAALVWLSVSLFAPELIAVLATETFAPASTVVPFLAGALIINGMTTFAPGLAIAGRTELIAAISLLTLTVVVALNLALVPIFGIEGAAVAGMGAAVVGFVASISLSQQHYRVPYRWPRVAIVCLLAGAALAVSIALPLTGAASLVLRLGLIAAVVVAARALRLLSPVGPRWKLRRGQLTRMS